MKKDTEYTFVAIDNDPEDIMNDAVVIDVDHDGDLLSAVSIDDDLETGDFITLSDDTVLFSDADMTDIISSDMDETDISMII
ncbi:MAG: hypothetical protein PHG27_03495 [Massilibacteroides sp.]|nr:hypothetical protein [Massilibacteroides sp.]MDD3061355.1 hypothetical protein [Massilibacteroides sp.]MDD4114651.1 hypothetical protein [Massilibacteroides sp.]MDD4659446.1 hypothetical protein [Massilibacteroides sp.]